MEKEINATLLLEYPTQFQSLPSYFTSHYCTEGTVNAALQTASLATSNTSSSPVCIQNSFLLGSLILPNLHPASPSYNQPSGFFHEITLLNFFH
jgi:hypothetical protein